MPAEKLSKMFGSARYAISTEETRYYLNGIFFHVLEDELLAVATDGHRLARITSNKPEGIEIDGIIIPRKCVGEVMKIVDEVEGNVGIELSAAKIRFPLGNVIITSKVIDGVRKSVVSGKCVSGRVDTGGGCIIKKKNNNKKK